MAAACVTPEHSERQTTRTRHRICRMHRRAAARRAGARRARGRRPDAPLRRVGGAPKRGMLGFGVHLAAGAKAPRKQRDLATLAPLAPREQRRGGARERGGGGRDRAPAPTAQPGARDRGVRDQPEPVWRGGGGPSRPLSLPPPRRPGAPASSLPAPPTFLPGRPHPFAALLPAFSPLAPARVRRSALRARARPRGARPIGPVPAFSSGARDASALHPSQISVFSGFVEDATSAHAPRSPRPAPARQPARGLATVADRPRPPWLSPLRAATRPRFCAHRLRRVRRSSLDRALPGSGRRWRAARLRRARPRPRALPLRRGS